MKEYPRFGEKFNGCGLLHALGVAVDAGKDSLGMAARVDDDIVKAPGTE